jgi:hypothetical protein
MECDRIRLIVDGCPISLTCYAVQGRFFCKADNIPPNLWTTHAIGTTCEEAERIVLEQARRLIAKSRSSARIQAVIGPGA